MTTPLHQEVQKPKSGLMRKTPKQSCHYRECLRRRKLKIHIVPESVNYDLHRTRKENI
jgi:hypothetical protein